MKKILSLVIFLFLGGGSLFAQEFYQMKNASDSTYGYSIDNPIKIKKGNNIKTLKRTEVFLNYLKTNDDKKLLLLWRDSYRNPNFDSEKWTLKYRTGRPVNGNNGILDKYVFVIENTRDTVSLFVDIYNKSNIEIPVGLKIDTTEYKGSKIILGQK